jgi:DNA-binding HxlR family transcriptional regulator
MTTRNYRRQDCPIAFALSIVGDQWTILLIRDVLSGIRRFEELQKRLGISRNLLTQRLKQLVTDGLLIKRQLPASRRHAYWPTPKCMALRPAILALAEWGQSWHDDTDSARVEITETDSGKAVGVRFCRLEDGQEISPAEITVERIPGQTPSEISA